MKTAEFFPPVAPYDKITPSITNTAFSNSNPIAPNSIQVGIPIPSKSKFHIPNTIKICHIRIYFKMH